MAPPTQYPLRPRNYQKPIEDLALSHFKMVFLSGPRQCGKTTLAKSFLDQSNRYFNWDQLAFRKQWYKQADLLAQDLLGDPHPRIVLDEFHKNPKWRNQLKGFFDLYGDKIQILLTGSARLNTYKRGADSLLGRFFHFHLHPFTLGEIVQKRPLSFKNFELFLKSPEPPTSRRSRAALTQQLLKMGGFPEPWQRDSEEFYQAWHRNRLELLVRQDLRDISQIMSTAQVELLAAFLPERVGSPLSIQSLAEDLDVAHTTARRWLSALGNVYYHFEIKPFSKSIPRSLKKEGKLYLYDWGAIESPGPRFENMVASHLLKLVDFYNDTGQADLQLHYLRDKEKVEVDFLICQRRRPLFTVEAKQSDLALDPSFKKFQRRLLIPHFQIVGPENIFRKFPVDHQASAFVMSFSSFFASLP